MKSVKTRPVLGALAAKAMSLGADALEVDHKDGCERVFAMKGAAGVGIASYASGSEQAKALLEELPGIGRKGVLVDALGTRCRLSVARFDSFGEEAFHVEIERTWAAAGSLPSTMAYRLEDLLRISGLPNALGPSGSKQDNPHTASLRPSVPFRSTRATLTLLMTAVVSGCGSAVATRGPFYGGPAVTG